MIFETFTLVERRDETPDLALLVLEGGSADFRSAHTRPGQFSAMRSNGIEPGYFALASEPGSARVEFLVRAGGVVADRLRELDLGARIEVSYPLGTGFPVETAHGRDLWLVGAGSAIGALRPVLRMVLADRGAFGRVTVLLGIRILEALAFRAELEAARDHGQIELHLAVSRPGVGWTGSSGWAQGILAELKPDLQEAVVFVCGMKPMVEAVREVAGELGARPGAVLTNV